MKHRIAESLDTPGLLPDLARIERRKMQFHSTYGVHLFADNLHDLFPDAVAQRQQRIDAGRKPANHAGTKHELMTGDDRFGGNFF